MLNALTASARKTRKIPAEVLFQYHIKSLSVVLQRSNAETQLNRADAVFGSALLPGVRNLMRYDAIMAHGVVHAEVGWGH